MILYDDMEEKEKSIIIIHSKVGILRRNMYLRFKPSSNARIHVEFELNTESAHPLVKHAVV